MNATKRLSVAAVVTAFALLGAALFGGVADAAKKKSSKKIVVAKTAPTTIPVGSTVQDSITSVPLNVSKKKGKGKVVGFNSVKVTYQLTGVAGELSGVGLKLTAPNGRTTGLMNPAGPVDAAVGPLTLTPNSPVGACPAGLGAPPPPPCPDPEDSLVAPYFGTIGDSSLEIFGGIPVKGNWTLKVRNSSTTQIATLNSAKIEISTQAAPTA